MDKTGKIRGWSPGVVQASSNHGEIYNELFNQTSSFFAFTLYPALWSIIETAPVLLVGEPAIAFLVTAIGPGMSISQEGPPAVVPLCCQ